MELSHIVEYGFVVGNLPVLNRPSLTSLQGKQWKSSQGMEVARIPSYPDAAMLDMQLCRTITQGYLGLRDTPVCLPSPEGRHGRQLVPPAHFSWFVLVGFRVFFRNMLLACLPQLCSSTGQD